MPPVEVENLENTQIFPVHSPGYLGARPTDAAVAVTTDETQPFAAVSPFAFWTPFIEILSSLKQPSNLGWQDIEDMREDDEIAANIDIIVSAASAYPAQVISPIVPENKQKEADYITSYFKWMFERMVTPLDEVRKLLTDTGMCYGTAVAEMIFGVDNFNGRDVYVVKDIRVLPTKDVAFFVDNFRRVLGILPTRVPNIFPIGGYYPLTPDTITRFPNVQPRSRYLVFTWRPIPADPRGRTALLPAWKPYVLKRQIFGNTAEWYSRYSIQSLWATTPENSTAEQQTLPNGQIKVTKPTDSLLDQLTRFRNSTVGAFPFGTEVHTLDVAKSGDIFFKGLTWTNVQIARAITRQHLATGEGEGHSRAAAEVHQDALGLVINEARGRQFQTIYRDLMCPLVEANFGPEMRALTSVLDLGEGDGFPITPTEIAMLARVGWFTERQKQMLDRRLGIPQRVLGEPVVGPTGLVATDPGTGEGEGREGGMGKLDTVENAFDRQQPHGGRPLR